MRLANASVTNSATDSQSSFIIMFHYKGKRIQRADNSMPTTLRFVYRTRMRLHTVSIMLFVFVINKLKTNRDFNFTGRMKRFVFNPASEINSNKFPESGV